MKITIKKEITEEHEITLPMFVKSGDIHYYMILDESEAIQVCTPKWSGGSIHTVPMQVALMQEYHKIDPTDFYEVFDIVMLQLKNRIKI